MTTTECNQISFGFEACGRREVVARFDGGTISSDGGALLLREVDQRFNLLPRLGQCFLDGRNQERAKHSLMLRWSPVLELFQKRTSPLL